MGLIEAYWNVNAIDLVKTACELVGLIEAYWNVNGGKEMIDGTMITV